MKQEINLKNMSTPWLPFAMRITSILIIILSSRGKKCLVLKKRFRPEAQLPPRAAGRPRLRPRPSP
ncbi:Protein of unknown function [Gryllus bimaculatus]|nr:Protein of unknown function [Gryllus bimaculatus]